MTAQLTPDEEIAAMLADEQARRNAPLTAGEKEVLEFARLSWRYLGPKEQACHTRFGHSLTRFDQRLNAVLDKPAAVVYDAQLVNRLLARRDEQRATHTRTPNGATR